MKIGINLLPLNKKKEVQMAEQFRAVLGWEAVIFSVVAIFFGFVFGIDYLLGLNLYLASDNKINKSGGAQYETIKYYERKFSEINSKISKISSITSGQIYWLGLFSKLESAIPDKVEISGISTNNFSLHFAGKAETREDLLLLKDNLEKEECFENINLPLSNLVSKENVIFQIDLEIKEGCIKNK
jgi:Tfp pilus assembly protein PilN